MDTHQFECKPAAPDMSGSDGVSTSKVNPNGRRWSQLRFVVDESSIKHLRLTEALVTDLPRSSSSKAMADSPWGPERDSISKENDNAPHRLILRQSPVESLFCVTQRGDANC